MTRNPLAKFARILVADDDSAVVDAITHSLENEQPELDELIVFTYQLKALMEALLLHESGFKARVIDEKLLETQRYRHIREMRGKR